MPYHPRKSTTCHSRYKFFVSLLKKHNKFLCLFSFSLLDLDIKMEAYDFERDPKYEHNLKSGRKVESEEDVDFKDELQDVSLYVPHKKLVCRPQKPKKKAQGLKGLKCQFGAIARALSNIQAQTTLINQKSKSLAISTECLTQQMEDVNRKLLIQRKRTQHIKDHLHKDEGPKKLEKQEDIVYKQAAKFDDDERDNGK